MTAGKFQRAQQSPIVLAIAEAENGTTAEIRVHLSKRWIEKDAFARATQLFHVYGMTKTKDRNAVLLYVNLRRRKFAIVGDEGIHQAVGQHYWENVARNLKANLLTTHSERAIASAVLEIGKALKHFFPLDVDTPNVNELPNEVTRD